MTKEVSKEQWTAQQGHREIAKGIKRPCLVLTGSTVNSERRT